MPSSSLLYFFLSFTFSLFTSAHPFFFFFLLYSHLVVEACIRLLLTYLFTQAFAVILHLLKSELYAEVYTPKKTDNNNNDYNSVKCSWICEGWITANSSRSEGHVHLGASGQNCNSGVWGKTNPGVCVHSLGLLWGGVVSYCMSVCSVIDGAAECCHCTYQITFLHKVISVFCMRLTWRCCFLFSFS